MKHPRRVTLAVLVAAACPIAGGSTAQAQVYSVQTCDNASVSGWSRFDTGFNATTWHTCGYPGGGLTGTVGPLPGLAGWTFTAPPNTELAGFSVRRSLVLPGAAPFALGRYRLFTEDPRAGYSAGRSSTDGPLAPGVGTEWVTGLRGQRSLTAEIGCEGGNPCVGQGSLTVLSARLDLRDDLPPQVVSASGGLLAGTVSGTQALVYSASDLGGGIARERLVVDGEPLSDRRLDCSFALAVPCPLSVSRSVPVDTTHLAEGAHRVQLEVWDATLVNRAAYGPFAITVDNVPGPAMVTAPRITGSARVDETLTTDDGTWSGAKLERSRQWQRLEDGAWLDVSGAIGVTYRVAAADRGHRLRVHVLAAGDQGTADGYSAPTAPVEAAGPPPVTAGGPVAAAAPAAPSPVAAEPSAGPARLRAAFSATGRTSVTVRWGERRTVAGTLSTAEGHPLAGARIESSSRSDARNAPAVRTSGVTTDAAGRFTYRIAGGTSRTVTFKYRDTATSVTVRVIPRVTVRVTRSGRLSGRVVGAPEGIAKWVQLQVASAHGWRTFAGVRLTPTGGAFSHRGAPHGRLRVLVPAAAGWPFLTGRSSSVVRP